MLELAIRAARDAGRVVAERFDRPHEISVKGLRDISTEADLAAETAAIRTIRQGCPGAAFVSEESNSVFQDGRDVPTWYIDPLDGTTNFARGLTPFSVSVAMARGGQVECGAVYDPLLDQLFSAERRHGAFLNGRRLQVSSRRALIDSLILLDWPRHQPLRDASARFLTRLVPRVGTVRSRGSAALAFCNVAAGWAEAYFQFTLSPWDVAAGLLIVEEAGGKVTGLRGQEALLSQQDWLATNGLIHEAILALGPYE